MTSDLFAGADMAVGYAAARPPVHDPVMTRVARAQGWSDDRRVAVDVGCGAGASTRAAAPWVCTVVGIDPVAAMVVAARRTAGRASYLVGAAEAIPVRSASIDVVIAAGSLNFVDLARFRDEATRVLRDDGVVVVYDFATGARSPAAPEIASRYAAFGGRWPRPTARRQTIDATVLTGAGFVVDRHEECAVSIEMTGAAYVDYLMTETNVAAAEHGGEDRADIRRWCTDAFTPIFATPRPIEFDAWFAVVRPAVS